MLKKQRITMPLLLLLLTLLMLPLDSLALTGILNIRYWSAPDHTRIVIDTSEEAQYSVGKGEQKISIDFKNTAFPETITPEIVLNKPGIEKIMLIPLPDKSVRVQLSLAEHVNTNVFKLKKFQQKHDRVVVDIELPDIEKKESEEREQIKVLRKDKIIIIDPGHGGDDPGAMGQEGTLEKDVVLAISRKLRDLLNKSNGYRSFLTREWDYYVPFKKRLKIAREYGGNLFVSIHADASRNRQASGSSVYCLSPGWASSEAAKVLAREENLADLIGGSPNGEDNGGEVEPIILNMFQTNTINLSKSFGITLLKHIGTVSPPKFRHVQEASFIVLKLPVIPSVLVETAYISNPREERLLLSDSFQEKIAESVAAAIQEFFPLQPSATPELTITKKDESETKSFPSYDKQKNPKPETTPYYKVKGGDTLTKIAKKYKITVSSLMKLNHLKLDDPLYVARQLKIKEQEADKKEKVADANLKKQNVPPSRSPEISTYKVKRGDTLIKIAKKYEITISSLMKLNHLKLDDPLYVDQTLRIP